MHLWCLYLWGWVLGDAVAYKTSVAFYFICYCQLICGWLFVAVYFICCLSTYFWVVGLKAQSKTPRRACLSWGNLLFVPALKLRLPPAQLSLQANIGILMFNKLYSSVLIQHGTLLRVVNMISERLTFTGLSDTKYNHLNVLNVFST